MKNSNIVQPEGNYYDKYHSTNFFVQWIMRRYFSELDSLLPKSGEGLKILDAGCGEGEVAGYIAEKYKEQCIIDAFDISKKIVYDAQKKYPSVRFSSGDIYNINGEGYKCVLCCEVLEHLEFPERALSELKRVSDEYIIVSVPREPIWRCLNLIRGKYIKDFGNTPGHIQHWSTRKFVHFLTENGLKVKKIRKPLPWTMVLLKKA